MMWPDHCVQGTFGSEFFTDVSGITVFPKGINVAYDSYSGFKDDGGQETGLNSFLKSKQIKNLIIYELATDYCVQFTVLHAKEAGYNVFVVEDLSEGVAEDTTKLAIKAMIAKGVKIIKMDTVTQWLSRS